MKAKTVKRLSLLLAIVSIVTIAMTGCGKDKVVDPNNLEPVDLTYYFTGASELGEQAVINEALSEYTKEKINATIKFQLFDYNAYDQKINSMIAGGEPADMIFTSSGTMAYRTYARKGSYYELTDLLDQYGQGVKEALGEFFLQGASIDGEIYALPTNKERAHNYGFCLQKKYVDKYNFDLSKVKTLADLEPMLEVIKQNEPQIYPLLVRPKQTWWTLDNMVGLVGSDYIPGAIDCDVDETKIINQYETEKFLNLAKLMRSWYEKGYVRKDAATNTDAVDSSMYFCDYAQLKPGGAASRSTEDCEWVQVELTEVVSSTSDTNNAMVAIPITSENPERAMMFLNLLYTDKYLLDTLYYGVEGKHYTRVSENIVEKIPNSGWDNNGHRWRFGNQMLASLTTLEDPEYWTKIEEFNNVARPLTSLGFAFDPDAVKTEMGSCENAYAEFAPVINAGTAKDTEKSVELLVSKLKEAGSDTIMAELEKQYNEFLKNK